MYLKAVMLNVNTSFYKARIINLGPPVNSILTIVKWFFCCLFSHCLNYVCHPVVLAISVLTDSYLALKELVILVFMYDVKAFYCTSYVVLSFLPGVRVGIFNLIVSIPNLLFLLYM